MQWFDVDKEGLRKLLERRGKARGICELASNVFDTDATRAVITLEPVPGRPVARLVVEDDDEHGFANLAHSWTLFAESIRKDDAEKRGRFNLGEKLVLALCVEATIASTTGSVVFDASGRRQTRARRERGSRFEGLLRMTREEIEEALGVLRTIIPPTRCETWLNGERLPERVPIAQIEATLPTEIADAEGNLRTSERKTVVRFYEPLPGEAPSIYELGIPVVETNDRYHSDVAQKVPLNFNRDNVTPAFLRKVRVLALNATAERLTEEDAKANWVLDAGSDKAASDDALTKVLDLRFGEKRVAYDPSDPEANARATAAGYAVIRGGTFSGEFWDNVRRAGAAPPAGQVTPSPKPFSPGGDPLKTLAPEKWTAGIKRVVAFAREVARELLGHDIQVTIANDIGWPHDGAYGPGGPLYLNLGRLGHKTFDHWPGDLTIDSLVVHEFGHESVSNHLSEAYYHALSMLGAKLAELARRRPDLWEVKP